MNWAGAVLVAVSVHAVLMGGAVMIGGKAKPRPVEVELEAGGNGTVEIVNVVSLLAVKTAETSMAETSPAPTAPPQPERPPQPTKPRSEPKPVVLPPDVVSLAPEPKPTPTPLATPQLERSAPDIPPKTAAFPVPDEQPDATQLSPPSDQPFSSTDSAEPGQLAPGSASSSSTSSTSGGPKGSGKPLSKKAQRAQQRYLVEVMAWLADHRVYPAELKKKKIEGTVKVRFTFMSSGEVTAVSIAQSSGSEELDAAATDVLRRANPLPPIPAILKRETLTITLPIEYSLITE